MGQVCGCIEVEESTVALTRRFGKRDRVLQTGRHCVPCCLGYEVAGSQSLRIQQLEVHCNTKTKDGFVVSAVASVHYGVETEQAADAFYKLTNAKRLLQSYVIRVVNAKIQAMSFGSLSEQRIQLAEDMEEELGRAMSTYGYKIYRAHLLNFESVAIVKSAFVEKNIAAKLKLVVNDKVKVE